MFWVVFTDHLCKHFSLFKGSPCLVIKGNRKKLAADLGVFCSELTVLDFKSKLIMYLFVQVIFIVHCVRHVIPLWNVI